MQKHTLYLLYLTITKSCSENSSERRSWTLNCYNLGLRERGVRFFEHSSKLSMESIHTKKKTQKAKKKKSRDEKNSVDFVLSASPLYTKHKLSKELLASLWMDAIKSICRIRIIKTNGFYRTKRSWFSHWYLNIQKNILWFTSHH